jgi:hypothetical protein
LLWLYWLLYQAYDFEPGHIMTKRTFNIPDEVDVFIAQIPKSEKSKFVSQALITAIKEAKKQELLECLDSIEPWEKQEQTAVDMIQRLRKEEITNLQPNQ